MSDKNEDKIASGIYAINDSKLKFEMLNINSNGFKCKSYDDFMKHIFYPKNRTKDKDEERYTVCFAPLLYDHDLENSTGVPSAVDAAAEAVSAVNHDGGLMIYVWDKHTEIIYCIEPNEYLYKDCDK